MPKTLYLANPYGVFEAVCGPHRLPWRVRSDQAGPRETMYWFGDASYRPQA